ncbi:MAG: hypothetical protein HY290_14040 [Planctomycetia bacterium]|nr:hypothetical protein [Planctomycetia bacterium]
MSSVDRRAFLQSAIAGLGAATLWKLQPASAAPQSDAKNLKIATFKFDATPPIGHGCCGGWIKPIEVVDDPMEGLGFVLLGAGPPIVVCVVDWTGILNEAHVAWRKALAEAAGTTPDRVSVHCVHQHNAPMACIEAEKLVTKLGNLPHLLDLVFFEKCLAGACRAVAEAIQSPQPVTHIAHGEGKVEKVAGNRRIMGPDGKLIAMRGSASKDPQHHALPEGLIDPNLKTVAFYNGDRKLAACHYYACHPMSYYGDGRATADFCGLARRRRQVDEPGCLHLYFNGCGGNIAAGKYNDGSQEARLVLTQRIYDGIVLSEKNLAREAVTSLRWATQDVLPQTDPKYDVGRILAQIADKTQSVANRNRPAYTVSWIRRCEKKIPITLSALHINRTSLVHFPAESFIEYQLRAQQMAPDRFVACAAYGDGGPWYIPTAEAYPQGGYEVSVAWCGPGIDDVLTQGIRSVLVGPA